MKIEKFKLADDKLSFELEEVTISVPLNVDGSISPGQWYKNFARKVKYAAEASGKTLSQEEVSSLSSQIIKNDSFFNKFKNTKSLWEKNNINAWMIAEGLINSPEKPTPPSVPEAPVLPLGNEGNNQPSQDEGQKTESPGQSNGKNWADVILEPTVKAANPKTRMSDEKKPTTTGKRKIMLFIGIGLIVAIMIIAAIWMLPPDDKLPAPSDEEIATAKAMLTTCVKVIGDSEANLESILSPESYLLVESPYILHIDRKLLRWGTENKVPLTDIGKKYLEEKLDDWETRCNCELEIVC